MGLTHDAGASSGPGRGGSRRLLAVWFADIVGYTELTGRNEEAAFAVVEELQELARRAVTANDGRIVKFVGDAALTVFTSSDSALAAAFQLIDAFMASAVVREHGCQLRVGMHVGEVLEAENGDVYGAGVNVASRIDSQAKPGEIVVSEDVYRQIRNRPGYILESRGEQSLKGISEPLHIYRVERGAEYQAPAPRVAVSEPTRPHFPRRPAPLVVGALGVVAVLLYFGLGAFGLRGPNSLMAQGLLVEGDQIILASFASPSDQDLADLVTEAIRVSLGSSSAFELMDPAQVRATLERMLQDPSLRPDAELAREIAVREGAKAVIDGSIGRVGSQFVLLAAVHGADGATLVSFRETAKGDDELIDAIDRLASDIRANIGESLQSVRTSEPLREVTTASLPALRSYTQGVRAYEEGDAVRSVELLRDAVSLDEGFAMAYRQLGVSLTSSRGTQEERDEAGRRAFELRDRLTSKERYLAEAYYHDRISGEVDAELRAYDQILALDPDEANTLSMKGRALAQHFADFKGAAGAMEQAVQADPRFFPPYSNLVWVRIFEGDAEGARGVQTRFETEFPATFWKHRGPFFIGYHYGDIEAAHEAADSLSRHPAAPDRWRSRAVLYMSLADAAAGRFDEARRHLAQDMRTRAEQGLVELALIRLADRIWLETLITADSDAARSLADSVLASGWLEAAAPSDRPYFMLARDAARAGATRVARELLRRWEDDTQTYGEKYETKEDIAVVAALLSAAQGDHDGALRGLVEIGQRTGPRFAVEEWPSQRHCQRCFNFDIARNYDALGRVDSAIVAYRRVIDATSDLVETPLNRILAWERLGALYEQSGETGLAAEAYRAFAPYWSGGDEPLKARSQAALSRAEELAPRAAAGGGT